MKFFLYNYLFCNIIFQLQQIPETSDSASVQANSQQDNSSVSTLSTITDAHAPDNNCEALCWSADALLEEARAHEEEGNLRVSINLKNH